MYGFLFWKLNNTNLKSICNKLTKEISNIISKIKTDSWIKICNKLDQTYKKYSRKLFHHLNIITQRKTTTHTNTPIQHSIHTAYTSQQKTNLLADFYKQLSTPVILLQEQHNTITKQINQLSSAHNTDTILTDPITTSDIQEAIQNQKETTPGSAGIKSQKDTTPGSAEIKNHT